MSLTCPNCHQPAITRLQKAKVMVSRLSIQRCRSCGKPMTVAPREQILFSIPVFVAWGCRASFGTVIAVLAASYLLMLYLAPLSVLVDRKPPGTPKKTLGNVVRKQLSVDVIGLALYFIALLPCALAFMVSGNPAWLFVSVPCAMVSAYWRKHKDPRWLAGWALMLGGSLALMPWPKIMKFMSYWQ